MDINTKLDLRDLIALKAMEATLKVVPDPNYQGKTSSSLFTSHDQWSGSEEKLAAFCYKLADAMMEARGKEDDWLNSDLAR